MKNILLSVTGCFLLFLSSNINAQLLSNGNITSGLADTNYFMDASNFEGLANKSYGRGLGFPRTDLTSFVFNKATASDEVVVSDFDGMVVYNSATGNTTAGQGVTTAVVPGFYYFSNPGNPGNITNGKWIAIGGNSGGSSDKINITSNETATHTLINNAQVYAVKGTFAASGTSTNVDIPSPAGMKGMYGITIYKAGSNTVYSRDLYSYTLGTANGNAVTGSQSMSVVYPAGTYDYVLEYLK
ncbi:hypothetical protein CEY12_09605 [Chryseobacterium sp. T16E-39]|uniref:hypothetical protein n=1 Tax=Chryseobacterium sp. T16E-39 TaxID=2015076 RepID=UPI000B5B0D3F|nr:hypothetical protein [Chryseobacterium sp. T16E-39]ASK30352.1 hypothetical protein CEY12_09605 [Chryseobacterium sp. T16E-39]